MKLVIVLSLLAVILMVVGASPAGQEQPQVAVKVVDKDHIDFLLGKEVVTTYHIKSDLPRPFFWPLKVDGIETTRAWPVGDKLPGETTDHPHHRSVWFCYGDVVPEGMELKSKLKGVEGVDFWSEVKGHGNIVCTKVDEPKTTRGAAWITTQNEWRTAEGDKVLDETRKLGFMPQGKGYLIVFDIDLAASVCPIIFADTKEGAMAIRIHPDINVKTGKGKIENAEKRINEAGCWGQKSAWCDYSGPRDAKTVGVAILDDSGNPYASCWHSRDYGLMGANPFGRNKSGFPAVKGNKDLVHLAKGEHLHLRYGVYVHTGDATEAGVARVWQAFVKMREMEKR
jgi:hypothetical protein